MISWISFWIDPTSVPGRVGLALTTLLTLSTQAIAIHLQLPPVGYAKAQDVWFGLCMFFLFGSLVEFAIVNMYTRLEQQQTSHANIKRETLSMIPLIRQVTKVCRDVRKCVINHQNQCQEKKNEIHMQFLKLHLKLSDLKITTLNYLKVYFDNFRMVQVTVTLRWCFLY